MRTYTSEQARKILGNINSSKLKKYVDTGKIRRYVRPGNKLGVYDANDVDTLQKQLQDFDQKYIVDNEKGARFGIAYSQAGST